MKKPTLTEAPPSVVLNQAKPVGRGRLKQGSEGLNKAERTCKKVKQTIKQIKKVACLMNMG